MRNELKGVEIQPFPEEKAVRFRLHFAQKGSQSVEFWTSFRDAMYLASALQKIQAQYKIPLPPRKKLTGKPKLSIVKEDNDQS
jgi:hypothetical protein